MGKLIFITGGVRSGKSGFAERYVSEIASNTKQTPIYVATGVAFDNEMQQRITRHQQDRSNSGLVWETYEVPYEIERYQTKWNNRHIVLFECVTTWLSNIFYQTESLVQLEQGQARYEKLETFKKTVTKWCEQGATVLLISNEILDDGVSPFTETALYQQTLGKLHQWIVNVCNEAYEVNAQIIERWK